MEVEEGEISEGRGRNVYFAYIYVCVCFVFCVFVFVYIYEMGSRDRLEHPAFKNSGI